MKKLIEKQNKEFGDKIKKIISKVRQETAEKVREETIKAERERIRKWAKGYMKEDIKKYGTDKHNISLEDLLKEL